MNDNGKHIVIVTRRFNENLKGIGVDGINKDNKNIKFVPHEISTANNLFHFWAYKLAKNDKVNFTLKDIPDPNKNKLTDLFQKLDEQCSYRIKEHKYLVHVHELETEENHAGIFVYHHWLDKQGFSDAMVESDNSKHFLEYLREFIADILNARGENINDFTVNWLIHDSDILPKTYDGCLYYGCEVYSPDYLNMSVDEFKKEIDFPRTLEKDNIWCFVHEENISGYYSEYIVNFNNNEYLHKPEQFHNFLYGDVKGCKRRIEILGLAEDERILTNDEMLFILHRKPEGDFVAGITLQKLNELLNNLR
jgi:hypothetical protein